MRLFLENQALATSPYTLTLAVSQSHFRTFISALEGAAATINSNDFRRLSQFGEEFHFGALVERFSRFRESEDFKEGGALKDLEARKRRSALKDRMQQRDCDIAALQSERSRHSLAQQSDSVVPSSFKSSDSRNGESRSAKTRNWNSFHNRGNPRKLSFFIGSDAPSTAERNGRKVLSVIL
jgi:hypothetical protein